MSIANPSGITQGVNQYEFQKIFKRYDRWTRGLTMETREALLSCVPIMRDAFRVNFESEGRRLGGQWQHLAEKTIKNKLRLVGAGAGGARLQRGRPIGGGFFTRSGGRITGVFHPSSRKYAAKHVFEPVRLTDILFNAATSNTPESLVIATPKYLIMGVKDIPYANLQRFGGGRSNVPARDYLRIGPSDKTRMLRTIEDWVWAKYVGELAPGGRRTRGFSGYVY